VSGESTVSGLVLADIQGFIMRTYAMPALRVFVLKIEQPEQAGAFLAALVSGDSDTPQLTTAVTWTSKPDYCVNVGFTQNGLAAMRLPQESLDTFPEEFVQGAVERAARVGDTGSSAPEHWAGSLASNQVHALVFAFAQTEAILERVSVDLRARFAAGPAFRDAERAGAPGAEPGRARAAPGPGLGLGLHHEDQHHGGVREEADA